ncbi:hypothetical protein VKT23_012435 [Stygiomarasmius scandens]|uniref:Uncharacterized protein n=1 Tax=Marasmiellus scandens TaxID=2682957 RepID=A0ABR1J9E7_9AGAR
MPRSKQKINTPRSIRHVHFENEDNYADPIASVQPRRTRRSRAAIVQCQDPDEDNADDPFIDQPAQNKPKSKSGTSGEQSFYPRAVSFADSDDEMITQLNTPSCPPSQHTQKGPRPHEVPIPLTGLPPPRKKHTQAHKQHNNPPSTPICARADKRVLESSDEDDFVEEQIQAGLGELDSIALSRSGGHIPVTPCSTARMHPSNFAAPVTDVPQAGPHSKNSG